MDANAVVLNTARVPARAAEPSTPLHVLREMSRDDAKDLSDTLNHEAATTKADKQARLTAEALVAAHVGRSNQVSDLNAFVEALTIALIAARAEGREVSG